MRQLFTDHCTASMHVIRRSRWFVEVAGSILTKWRVRCKISAADAVPCMRCRLKATSSRAWAWSSSTRWSTRCWRRKSKGGMVCSSEQKLLEWLSDMLTHVVRCRCIMIMYTNEWADNCLGFSVKIIHILHLYALLLGLQASLFRVPTFLFYSPNISFGIQYFILIIQVRWGD